MRNPNRGSPLNSSIDIQDKYACTMERKVMVFSTTKKKKKKNDGHSETLFVYPTANQKVV